MIKRSVGTHDGTFHADEVTACALLILFGLVDEEGIVRTRDPKLLNQCEYVCDVGGEYRPEAKRFDHHQSEYQGELSSAGMVWLYLKEIEIVDETMYDALNRALIWGVDAHDNGRVNPEVGMCNFSGVVSNFVPVHYDASSEMQNAAFKEALLFVLGHLKRFFERYSYTKSCKETVAKKMEEKKLFLFFEEALPWIESFFELGGESHPALFVIMPSGSHWKLRGIPPTFEKRMQVRKPLPLQWAGLLENDLKRVSGIPGAVFCHKGRFISVWETKEDVLKALEFCLKEI